MTTQETPSSRWLATTFSSLLEKRYGGRIPSLRTISQDIQESVGTTLSHGQIRNILRAQGTNLTDRSRKTLADFFEVPVVYFYPPEQSNDKELHLISQIITKLSSFNQAQLKAVEKAVAALEKEK